MPKFDIAAVSPDAPEALALIAGSEAELASLYIPEHRFAFSPQELIDAGVVFLVARADGVPMACGGIAPLDGYGELKRIYVAPDWRGAGAAAAIVSALEAEARALGLPLARLETGAASPAAIRLYTREGYARRGPFGSYAENGSSVYMEKALGG
jgi:putative acetyltransferase